MRVILALVLAITAVVAKPRASSRILQGEPTDIQHYPELVSVLFDNDVGIFVHIGGGVILNNRAILSAAHLFYRRPIVEDFRYRAGSTFNNKGGEFFDTLRIIIHPEFVMWPADNDLAIIHICKRRIEFNSVMQPAVIAGPKYPVPDNEEVWAAGWGYIDPLGPGSPRLRHVQMLTINREECMKRYNKIGYKVTENMICSGWLDVGGRDQCDEDNGGPLYHKKTVIGIFTSFRSCGNEFYPGVNMRVGSYSSWIIDNA
ncbi:hypothetical protein ACJJTC_018862 [Scirpophaga incertulas]